MQKYKFLTLSHRKSFYINLKIKLLKLKLYLNISNGKKWLENILSNNQFRTYDILDSDINNDGKIDIMEELLTQIFGKINSMNILIDTIDFQV